MRDSAWFFLNTVLVLARTAVEFFHLFIALMMMMLDDDDDARARFCFLFFFCGFFLRHLLNTHALAKVVARD